jgi:hypothetical protein
MVEIPVKKKIDTFTELKLRTVLYRDFGEEGVKMLELIDGKKDVKRLIKELGSNEDVAKEILTFLEQKKYIKLRREKK